MFASMRTLKRTVAAVAVVLGLALAGFAGLHVLGSRDDPVAALEARVSGDVPPVKVVVVVRDPGESRGRAALITSSGGVQLLSDPESYAAIRISPDGRSVAGLIRNVEGTVSDAEVLLIDLVTGKQTRTRIPRQDVPLVLSWSPDSLWLAVDGGSLNILAVDGTVEARIGSVASVGPEGTAVAGGGFGWTRDSRQFSTVANGEIRVFRTDSGLGLAWSVRDLLQGADETAWFAGYTPEGLAVYSLPRLATEVGLRLDSGGAAGVVMNPTIDPTTRPDLSVPTLTQPQVDSIVRSRPEYRVMRARPLEGTADGVLVELSNGTKSLLVAVFGVQSDGSFFELSGLAAESLDGALYDGWAGA